MSCQVKSIKNMELVECKNKGYQTLLLKDDSITVCEKHASIHPFDTQDKNREVKK